MKSWPKVKLGKGGVCSNIVQNLSSGLWSWLVQFTWKVDKNWIYVKLKPVRTLLKITCLATRKSYLVMIGPNFLKIMSWHLGSGIWLLLPTIHLQVWHKFNFCVWFFPFKGGSCVCSLISDCSYWSYSISKIVVYKVSSQTPLGVYRVIDKFLM